MLPKASRLRHEKDFARLSVKGRPLYGPYCILRARKSGSEPSKIGFVASGKMFKKAVDRNRVRRRMREAIRPHLDEIPPGYDMSFIARKEVADAEPKELKASMLHLIEKMPAEIQKPLKRRPKPPKSRKGVIAYSKELGVPRPPGKRPQNQDEV
ncbi:ribonuclease P protein component [Candidatus Uhrbacteria bacterium]|nr:ribonuclease P protein component [Candidatus Uhrbacteria bacterium]MBD3284597.1 ribonuclease P protein component [Candidatus Uhrbacteria bacterium]